MRIALTGASGIVGGFVLTAAQDAGHHVTVFGRDNGYHLGDAPDLGGYDALIHCAFAHIPGRYRGGEGGDAAGFRRLNLDGSTRLFDAAAQSGVPRIVFLSSRAVHDGYPPGTVLTDDLPARPSSLYGQVKALAETHLQQLAEQGILTTALRATGVYGPGPAHKWRSLFADYLANKPVTPRVATELHGDDLAAAIVSLLKTPGPPRIANASDLILDRHDLLAEFANLTGCRNALPARADDATLSVLRCDALRALGWAPGGMKLLRKSLPLMLDPQPEL
ncbi:NAD(P)-dependent oxidoreductase [Paracoccus sp. 11-3]|uniref:NAD(P)-dependent oxidoreductase n=1 Tax=Paracoccus amoyensis TaxID=2760093 RepID=A0A926JCV6_9RHOB|nr:NAD(P)-dependent oxidoreductase [Paracoccus amoyensis]MBC9247285.1 NAD(P)-dependent oxidoreductase [Paracoccus amoyensis]